MKKILLFAILFPMTFFGQGYTSYFTGNSTNIETTPEFGVCLMGGATEHDNAMKWLLQKANGGDVVVLRSSGSNGYNNYLYSELGITVNSVETLVITSIAGATNPYVLDKVANAEMIWFAGGDQYNYISFFKDNEMENLLNYHINVKNAPIGGTSAGMAILGGRYFSAQNGTVTSAQAMNNPYASNVTLGGYSGTTLPTTDFLYVPFLSNIITDTHYDNPDRRGRQSTFIARFTHDFLTDVQGIAANEYVAICIGTDGKAYVYGDYPNYQEFAYFVQANCSVANTVENCQSGQPLTWNFFGQALHAYKVPGTMNGTNYFDLNNWQNGIGHGGSWESWSVNNGVFSSVAGTAPSCILQNESFTNESFLISPNPFQDYLFFEKELNGSIEIYDELGRQLFFDKNYSGNFIDTSKFNLGVYFIKITNQDSTFIQKILKK